MFQFAQIMRHHCLHEITRLFVDLFVINDDFTDIPTEIVTQSANNDIAFLIQQDGALVFGIGLLDSSPQGFQVIQVPAKFVGFTVNTRSPHDHTHIIGHIQLIEGLLNLLAIFTFNAPRNAPGFRIIRHQNQITPGQTQISCQGCAFITTFFFINLNEDFLAFTQHVFDIRAIGSLGIRVIILRCYFAKRQKAMTLRAIVDESGFKARFDTGNNALVDIGLFLCSQGMFNIKIV